MPSPSDLKFTDSHEWFRVEGGTVTIGITQYAADELTDVTYVEMKSAGEQISAGASLGEVESVKTTSEVYSVVSGEIVETNPAVSDNPALLNTDPFGEGWLVKMKVADMSPLDGLMNQATYDEKYPVG